MRSNSRKALENASGEEVLPPRAVRYAKRLNEGLPPAVQRAARDAHVSASGYPRRGRTSGLSPEVSASAAVVNSSSKTSAETHVSKPTTPTISPCCAAMYSLTLARCCLLVFRQIWLSSKMGENQQEAVGVQCPSPDMMYYVKGCNRSYR